MKTFAYISMIKDVADRSEKTYFEVVALLRDGWVYRETILGHTWIKE